MRNMKIAALTAVLCLGTAVTVFAQPGMNRPGASRWDSIGSVTVEAQRGPWNGPATNRDVRNFDLGGPVERLQLRADGASVNCRSINARYGNGPGRGFGNRGNGNGFGNRGNGNGNGPGFGNRGRNDQIFTGMIRQGQTVNIDMPGVAQELDGLVFNCATMGRRDAVIRISADVGRYRNDWMRSPNWSGTWSRMFNWGSNVANNWQPVGRESFEGRGDTEMTFVGLRGRQVDSIALMPVNADARCSRVEATFGNGRRQALNINNGDYLRRGQYAQIDLPGNMRNVDSLYLRCQAVNAGRVEIALYTSH